jgi:hypothetical protein
MFDAVKGIFGRRDKPAAEPLRATRPEERVRIVNVFHAVSIKAGPRCCQAARGMSGIRYLSKEAPRLPLPQCDLATCECRYVHHDDRRSEPRRSADGAAGRGGMPFAGPDRRKSRQDRRATG